MSKVTLVLFAILFGSVQSGDQWNVNDKTFELLRILNDRWLHEMTLLSVEENSPKIPKLDHYPESPVEIQNFTTPTLSDWYVDLMHKRNCVTETWGQAVVSINPNNRTRHEEIRMGGEPFQKIRRDLWISNNFSIDDAYDTIHDMFGECFDGNLQYDKEHAWVFDEEAFKVISILNSEWLRYMSNLTINEELNGIPPKDGKNLSTDNANFTTLEPPNYDEIKMRARNCLTTRWLNAVDSMNSYADESRGPQENIRMREDFQKRIRYLRIPNNISTEETTDTIAIFLAHCLESELWDLTAFSRMVKDKQRRLLAIFISESNNLLTKVLHEIWQLIQEGYQYNQWWSNRRSEVNYVHTDPEFDKNFNNFVNCTINKLRLVEEICSIHSAVHVNYNNESEIADTIRMGEAFQKICRDLWISNNFSIHDAYDTIYDMFGECFDGNPEYDWKHAWVIDEETFKVISILNSEWLRYMPNLTINEELNGIPPKDRKNLSTDNANFTTLEPPNYDEIKMRARNCLTERWLNAVDSIILYADESRAPREDIVMRKDFQKRISYLRFPNNISTEETTDTIAIFLAHCLESELWDLTAVSRNVKDKQRRLLAIFISQSNNLLTKVLHEITQLRQEGYQYEWWENRLTEEYFSHTYPEFYKNFNIFVNCIIDKLRLVEEICSIHSAVHVNYNNESEIADTDENAKAEIKNKVVDKWLEDKVTMNEAMDIVKNLLEVCYSRENIKK